MHKHCPVNSVCRSCAKQLQARAQTVHSHRLFNTCSRHPAASPQLIHSNSAQFSTAASTTTTAVCERFSPQSTGPITTTLLYKDKEH